MDTWHQLNEAFRQWYWLSLGRTGRQVVGVAIILVAVLGLRTGWTLMVTGWQVWALAREANRQRRAKARR
jgi:hypothetical protein